MGLHEGKKGTEGDERTEIPERFPLFVGIFKGGLPKKGSGQGEKDGTWASPRLGDCKSGKYESRRGWNERAV